jgi:hypothetical protein
MTGVPHVVMSRSFQLSAAALALGLLPAACSSAGSPMGAAPATSLAAATRLAEPVAPERAPAVSTGPFAADGPRAVADARQRPSSAAPLSALTQIVTAQALLVSLLLTPLPSAAGTERVEPTAPTAP